MDVRIRAHLQMVEKLIYADAQFHGTQNVINFLLIHTIALLEFIRRLTNKFQ